MLRRTENVRVSHHAGFFTNKGPITLHVCAKSYTIFRKMPLATYQQMLYQSLSYPVCFGLIGERAYWLFADRWHWENDNLAAEQVYALLVTRGQRQQATINRAMTMVSMQQDPAPTVRTAIPADVKQLVWQRDGGRCRGCGANVELQFDHVIPLAYGHTGEPASSVRAMQPAKGCVGYLSAPLGSRCSYVAAIGSRDHSGRFEAL